MAKILIVEDHPIYRRGIRDILTATRNFAHVAEAEDATRAAELLRKERWDAMVLDISLPGKSGLEFLKEVKHAYPKLPVLILSFYSEDQYALRMLKAGASGYLTKNRTPEELIGALTRLLQGKKYISASVAEKVIAQLEPGADKPAHELLSDREFEVLKLIAQGTAPRDICIQLCISPRTVSTYRARLLQKLKFKNNAQLVQYAITNKLIET
ncbi:MAG TPA: response regulator transcription factor [Acidobacteriota bacterium]|nr:response regulator transcription factor [Acidobacteriota bacterium]